MSENNFIAEYEEVNNLKTEDVPKIENNTVEENDNLIVSQEPGKNEDKETDPVNDAARAQGWVPQEEWDGDPADWRNSQVFLERGDYFKTMSTQRKEIDKLNKTVTKMAEIQSKVRINEREKVIKELSQTKLEAMEEGDYNKVMDVDAEISKVRLEPEEIIETTPLENNHVQETISNYIEKNKWYTSNPEMRAHADMLSTGYSSINANASIEDIIAYVDSEVKTRYPQEFGNSVPSASPVAGNNRTTKPYSTKSGGKKKTLNDLPVGKRDMYAQIGQSFVDSGAVNSIDEYIAELEKIGEL